MAFQGLQDHHITLAQGAEFTKNYRANNPNSMQGGFFSAGVVKEILAQPNCAGVRYYYGWKDNSPVLVLVGTDVNEHDMVNGVLAEFAWPCPPFCDSPNALNSDMAN